MMRMRALNEESSEESEGEEDIPTITKEAQEQETFTLYNEALKYLGTGNEEQAKIVLQDLLDSAFLSEYVKPEGSEIVRPPVLMLKYSCLKNMGNILVKDGHIQDGIEYLLKATYLDGTDVTLWFKIGMAAVEVVDYVLAVDAFVECLHFSPRHWPSLGMVITMFFVTGNYMSSLYFISRALVLDPEYVTAMAFRDQILIEQPTILEDFKEYYPESDLGPLKEPYDKAEAAALISEAFAMKDKQRERWRHLWEPVEHPTQALLAPLCSYAWKELGDALVKLVQHMYDNDIPLSSPIALTVKLPAETSELVAGTDAAVVAGDPGDGVEVDCGKEKASADQKDEKDLEDEGEVGREEGRRKRRNSISFLEQWMWGGKRRSARVRSTARKDADDNVGQALRALVPPALLPCKNKEGDPMKVSEDSQDTMELYKLFKQSESGTGGSGGGTGSTVPTREQVERAVKEEAYFSTEAEQSDVKSFVQNASKHLIDILREYIATLGGKWASTWPPGLTDTFVALYPSMRRRCPLPSLLDLDESADGILSEALATLLNAELLLDRAYDKADKGSELESAFPFEELGFATEARTRVEMPPDFAMRLYWLKARLMLHLGNIDEAILDFDVILILNEQRGEPISVCLPNCLHDNAISSAAAQRQITTLTRNQSLSEIENLYAQGSYEELAAILQETVKSPPPPPSDGDESSAVPDRHTQLAILMDSLIHLGRHRDAFYWGEACLHEALHKYLASEEPQQTAWSSTLEKLLAALQCAIDVEGNSVVDAVNNTRLSRLVQNVTHLLSHQLEAAESVVAMPVESVGPWLVLQAVLARHEERSGTAAAAADPDEDLDDDDVDEDEIPASIRVLITAHDFLARRSWCCSNDGALLLRLLEVAVPRLRDPGLMSSRDQLGSALEQAVYCLYGHPGKKAKGRSNAPAEHGVPQITLTWARASLLFRLFQPDELPEFDSYRVGCVTADVEGLLRRIVALVPAECDPAPVLSEMKEYIDGTLDELPTTKTNFPEEMSSLYYLLADYNFKNNQSAAAAQHYLVDACLNPGRVDSWAGMALARGSQLETRLNSCERLGSATDFLCCAKAVQRCYKRALHIDAAHSLLWIEYGSFVYMVHSFCCRLTKQENESMAIQTFNLIETTKEEMLTAAVNCFSAANKVWYATGEEAGVQDERWLHHYMLGKAAEKTGADPAEYLSQYARCVGYLHEAGAAYPCRISYNNPQNLSVEALEVYYRIHASILKYLEAREGKGIKRQTRELFQMHIKNACEGPFITKRGKETEEDTRKRPAAEPVAVDAQIDEKRQRVDVEHAALIGDVIDAMEDMICIVCNEKSPALEEVVIEISDDEVEPAADMSLPLPPAPVPAAAAKTEPDSLLSGFDDLTRVQICDIIGVPLIDADLEEGEVTHRRFRAELKTIGDDQSTNVAAALSEVKPDVAADEDVMVTSLIVRDEAVPDEFVKKTILDKVPGLKELVKQETEGRSGSSSSYEETFLKFIAAGADAYDMEEGNVQPSSNSALEYLDETDGTIKEKCRTVDNVAHSDSVLETSETAPKRETERGVDSSNFKTVTFNNDGFECSEKVNSKPVLEVQEAKEVVSVKETASEGSEGNIASADTKEDAELATGREDLRRSSQESTTTTNTTTGESTLSSSSDDSSDSDSSDSSTSSDSSESESADAEADETVVVAEKTIEKVEPEPEELVKENGDLAASCTRALEECVSRFPQHYKALYRLGHWHFLRANPRRSVATCRDFLLGSHRSAAGVTLQGLFSDRKNNNFFNGVWRIPTSEIDRPGSFACHMSRCVQLVMEALTELRDHALLLEISVQLRRTPDSDKKYLRDSEREQLSRQALSLSVRAIRAKLAAGPSAALAVDTYKAYRRAQKHLPHKEKLFAGLLQETYRAHAKVQGPVLDAAIKFCQLELAAVKTSAAAAAAATSTSSPSATFPSPSAAGRFTHKPGPARPSTASQRSRGRPPNTPRAGAATTGFEYPKAAAWKPAAAKQPFPNLLAPGLAQNMSALPFFQMHSLFNDMTGLGGLAGLSAGNLAGLGAGLGAGNLAGLSAANSFSPRGMGGNLSGAHLLDQQLTAFNMLNYQVQMGNYQTELLRHYSATTTARDRPSVSITPVSSQLAKPAGSQPPGKHSAVRQSSKHSAAASASKHAQGPQPSKHPSSTHALKIMPAHSTPSLSSKHAAVSAHSAPIPTKHPVAHSSMPAKNAVTLSAKIPAKLSTQPSKHPPLQLGKHSIAHLTAPGVSASGKQAVSAVAAAAKPSLQEKLLAASASLAHGGRSMSFTGHGAASLTVCAPQAKLTAVQLASKQLAEMTAKPRRANKPAPPAAAKDARHLAAVSITHLPQGGGKTERRKERSTEPLAGSAASELMSGLKNFGSSVTLTKPDKQAPYRPTNYSSVAGYPYAQSTASRSSAGGFPARSELSTLMTGTLLPQDLTTRVAPRSTPRLGSEVTMTTVPRDAPLDLASVPKSITVTSLKKPEPPVETITLD